MKTRFLATGLLAIVLPLGAVACGADSTGELDKSDVKNEFVKAGMEDAQADCMADAIIDADFTKDELETVSSGKQDGIDSEKYDAFMKATTKCVLGS